MLKPACTVSSRVNIAGLCCVISLAAGQHLDVIITITKTVQCSVSCPPGYAKDGCLKLYPHLQNWRANQGAWMGRHVSLEVWGPLSSAAEMTEEKTNCLWGIQCLWNVISRRLICVKFKHDAWIDVVINALRKKCKTFLVKVTYPQKPTSSWVFQWVK